MTTTIPDPSPKKQKRRLSVFLLKPGVQWEKAVRSEEELTGYGLAASSGLRGRLFIKPLHPRPPWWLEFLQSVIEDEITKHNVGTMSAALFLEVNGRTVVYTFGYGRHLVDEHSVEPDFGLKVALNALDPERLRSLDLRRYEEVALLTRQQASRGSAASAFSLDRLRDVLTSVVGTPQDEELGTRLAGRDSLALTIPVSVSDLADVAGKLIGLYADTAYRESFAWIDQIQPVRDPELGGRLDELVVEALGSGGTDQPVLYLAPPELLPWEEVEGFTYTSQGRKDDRVFQELELSDYLRTFEQRRKKLSLDALKHDKAQVHRSGLAQPVGLASVYRCLVYETSHKDHRYVLLAGDWWQIDREFVEDVETQLGKIPVSTIDFPNASVGEREDDYVVRAAAQVEGSQVLDKRTIRYGGGRSQIEICDILTPDGRFIHVKARSRSSTLSHLWSQGTVSAEAFSSDAQFRSEARALVPEEMAPLFPEQRPNRDSHEVVYLVLGADRKHPWRSLPFFGKVALMQAARQVQLAGLRLSLVGAPRAPG